MNNLLKIIFILLLLVLGLLFLIKKEKHEISFRSGSPQAEAIKITFLDIGQGDATLIEWPDQTQMLVDCAKDARVLEALGRHMNFHDKTIDYLLITHPDIDHYGGCTDVVKRFQVRNIIYTGAQKESSTWQTFWGNALTEGARLHFIKSKQIWRFGSSTLTFLYPDSDLSKSDDVGNNSSIIFKLSFGEMDVLLTGDAEEEIEAYLVDTYKDELDVELLKAGHHGSQTSSIQPFISVVTPEHTVISAGKNNSYGHPSRRVTKRLERVSSTIWRTDLDGDITAYITSTTIDLVTGS